MRILQKIFILSLLLAAAAVCRAAAPLYVVDLSRATTGDKLVTISLQGLANRNPQSASVYTIQSPEDEAWLQWALHLNERPARRINAAELFQELKGLAAGQILCDPVDPTSLNIATTLAGLHDAVLADRDLGLKTLFDLRRKFDSRLQAYKWVEENLPAKYSKEGLVLMGADLAFRDYAIKERLLVLPFPSLSIKDEWVYVGRLAGRFAVGTPIFAPAPERMPPSILPWGSRMGHPVTGIEGASNLSWHAAAERLAVRQWRKYARMEGKIFVCFIFSGGPDIAYVQGRMKELWDQPQRPSLNLGWALPVQFQRLAPGLFQSYYAGSYASATDGFLFEIQAPQAGKSAAFAALQEARRETDIRNILVVGDGPAARLEPALAEIAARYRPAGLFVPDSPAVSSRMVGDTVLMTKGFSSSSPQEILDALSALPTEKGGLIFVRVQAKVITTRQIAEVVEMLPEYFVPVGPDEFILLAKQVLSGEEEEVPSQAAVTLKAPAFARPDELVKVSVETTAAAPQTASLLYRKGEGPLCIETMKPAAAGAFQATVGPLLSGGKWSLQARITEGRGITAWSQIIELQVPPDDADNDGFSRIEERLLATDPGRPDTDADGLPDGYDAQPLSVDASPALYFGPLLPRDDGVYLVSERGSRLENGARKISRGGYFIYRIPLQGAPPDTPISLALQTEGEPKVAVSIDGENFSPAPHARIRQWHSFLLPQAALPRGACYVAVMPEDEKAGELAVLELAIISLLEGPSIAQAELFPAYPGPGMPIGVSARVWAPAGVKSVEAAYRAGAVTITVPMQKAGEGPYWTGELYAFDNGRRLDWWVTALDNAGRRASGRIRHAWIGTMPGETISLTPEEALQGSWKPGESGWYYTREARKAGARDRAEIQVTGGRYEAWVLANGQGREVGLWVDGAFFAGIDSRQPAGWQHLGRVRLARGDHTIEVVSGAGEEGVAAQYGQVLLTAISSLRPPQWGALEIANSLILFSPTQGQELGDSTPVAATAAGNLTRVDFNVDGALLKRFNTPPYYFDWDSSRLAPGPHKFSMAGFGRAAEPLAVLEIEVNVPAPAPEGGTNE